MNTIKNIITIIVLSFAFVGCDTTPTVQEYIVKHQEDERFNYLDISSNILQLKNFTDNAEIDDILKSIHKVNVLTLKDENKNIYDTESKTIAKIIKDSHYKMLSKIDNKYFRTSISYLGNDDSINELLVFVKVKKEKQLTLIRVLGDQMDVSKISELINNTKIDKNSNDFSVLNDFIKNL